MIDGCWWPWYHACLSSNCCITGGTITSSSGVASTSTSAKRKQRLHTTNILHDFDIFFVIDATSTSNRRSILFLQLLLLDHDVRIMC